MYYKFGLEFAFLTAWLYTELSSQSGWASWSIHPCKTDISPPPHTIYQPLRGLEKVITKRVASFINKWIFVYPNYSLRNDGTL